MTQTWDGAFLDSMRLKGDDWADGLIDRILDQGGAAGGSGDEALGKFLTQVVSIQDGVPDDLHPEAKAFFLAADRPDWVDEKMVEAGQEVYAREGVEIGPILMCASLPACYADAPGVNVLYITHQLTQHPERRIIETLRFVLGVMNPGSLESGGTGLITAKKIRLIHAANRHILRNTPSMHWDEAAWGCPLNQEDLAITLMTFSITVLDSLAKLDITLTPNDEEAYFHCWRYVGHLMGIVPQLIPDNLADGRTLMNAIAGRVYGSCEAGKAVTKALVDFLEGLFVGNVFKGIVPSKMRFLVGDKVADLLAIPRADWTEASIRIELILHTIEHKLLGDRPAFAMVTEYLGRELLKTLEAFTRTDGRPAFHVPDSLRGRWGLRR